MNYDLRNGDCVEIMRSLLANSVDSIVTDPPYELGFMGKSWDSTGIAYSVRMWDEALRVLKPGGHLLAFSGSRTYHRMACAIEDAGFEIRDQIMWVYGSGFPKSMDVSKAIDKQAGVERRRVEYIGGIASDQNNYGGNGKVHVGTKVGNEAITDKAKQWAGWGTALKPAHEPIVMARKPLIGTVAANVIIHGTGALNIDGSRIEFQSEADKASATPQGKVTVNVVGNMPDVENDGRKELDRPDNSKGRWPANFIHDGSDEVVELFPDTKSGKLNTASIKASNLTYGNRPKELATEFDYDDAGSAARFFYCAKASKKDRNAGLDDFEEKQVTGGGGGVGDYLDDVNSASGKFGSEKAPSKNNHPTVKPTDLMRYLVKLVTPPNGTVLDPFTGSGSTGKAAMLEGFNFIGCELDPDYVAIANARIKHALEEQQGRLL